MRELTEAQIVASQDPRTIAEFARTATPTQIDDVRCELGAKLASARNARQRAATQARRFESKPASRDRYLADVAQEDGRIAELSERFAPLEEVFASRGGWNRYYLCTSTGGHVHRSRSCGTLRRTSVLVLLTEHSGMNRDDFVALAGEGACTVCFPDAPVDRENRLAYAVKDREQAARYAAAQDEKRAAKAAKELVVKCTNGERPKTVVSVERVAVAAGSRQRYLARKAFDADRAGERGYFEKMSRLAKIEGDTVAECVWALAGKTGETTDEVQARIDAKAEKHFAKNY
jgi:hypothetical protein